jgi:hypothetical protein
MLLGQLVAISVASNLFYLALLTHTSSSSSEDEGKSKPEAERPAWASPVLYIPVLLSLATIFYSPYTSVTSGTFLPNLLLMHSLIVIPLVVPPSSVPLLPNIRVRTFAIFLSAMSILLHAHATLRAFYSLAPGITSISEVVNWSSFMASAWEILHAHHPAQSSIGWDVVWTTVSFMVWTLIGGWREEGEPRKGSMQDVLAPLTTPLLSVGAVAPWVFEVFTGGDAAEGVKEE